MDLMRVPSWQVRRLGSIMESNLADPHEAGGVLNPAVARGPDGQLYVLPRLVGAGNYSRIGLARVVLNRSGVPVGVERLGVVLEPQAAYEINPWTGGGVEDPRITYFASRRLYVMTYTAYGSSGPRIAVATSNNLMDWRRLGLVRFAPYRGVDLQRLDNKDAVLFPEPVMAPDGQPALALMHRPGRGMPHPDGGQAPSRGLLVHPSMWISYAPLEEIAANKHIVFGQHHLLISPRREWEWIKVGAGTPPVRLGNHWLVLYHGVSSQFTQDSDRPLLVCYSAGILLLDGGDPRQVLYRSAQSVLTPKVAKECSGVVPCVVFPTGLELRADGTLDIYYGMADTRIGVARACVGDILTGLRRQAA
jgi:beta-1,2-mannobiose phosphorylase / 1,2-beta-oligomannan phosphorylase